MSNLKKILPLAIFFLLAVSCVRTGEIVLPDNPRTISIPLVKNKTFEYGVEERVTDVLIQEFLRDGRLKVVDREDADLLLDVTIIKYKLRTVSYDREEEAVVSNLATEIEVNLTDQRSGQAHFKNERFFERGPFFLSNEPQLRREEQIYIRLAENIISRLLEGW